MQKITEINFLLVLFNAQPFSQEGVMCIDRASKEEKQKVVEAEESERKERNPAQESPKEDVEKKDVQKKARARRRFFGIDDPDLIEIGGGNPWNFYPL